jgi:predicted DNA-binding ribbon-helix-helix protein
MALTSKSAATSYQPINAPTHPYMHKRSVKLNDRKTGVSLEDGFWHALREIAAAQNISAQDLILKIDNERTHANLSSAIRLHILSYYRERCDAKSLGNKPARQ